MAQGSVPLQGCGVVEFGSREEAERAIKELNDTQFMGRPIFVREVRLRLVSWPLEAFSPVRLSQDREDEARYGQAAMAPAGGARGGFGGGYGGGGFGGRGGFSNSPGAAFASAGASFAAQQGVKQLQVTGVRLRPTMLIFPAEN